MASCGIGVGEASASQEQILLGLKGHSGAEGGGSDSAFQILLWLLWSDWSRVGVRESRRLLGRQCQVPGRSR
jgi:hypothetical protein